MKKQDPMQKGTLYCHLSCPVILLPLHSHATLAKREQKWDMSPVWLTKSKSCSSQHWCTAWQTILHCTAPCCSWIVTLVSLLVTLSPGKLYTTLEWFGAVVVLVDCLLHSHLPSHFRSCHVVIPLLLRHPSNPCGSHLSTSFKDHLWGSQLNRLIFGIWLRAKWPSHSRRRFTLVDMVFKSLSDFKGCDMLGAVGNTEYGVNASVVKESSFLSCFLRGIQHSTDTTHAWLKLRFLSMNTPLRSAPKAFDACAIHLSMSGSILPDDAITETGIQSHVHIHCCLLLSSSMASLPTALIDKPKALLVVNTHTWLHVLF